MPSYSHISLKFVDFYTDFIYCCGGLDSKGKMVHSIEKINPEASIKENADFNKFTRYSACAIKTDENTVWFIGKLFTKMLCITVPIEAY